MRRWQRLMVVLCFVAASGVSRAQIPAVVTLAVNDGRRVELADSAVAVEKLDIHKSSIILGDGKWSNAPYKPFIGHPDATLF